MRECTYGFSSVLNFSLFGFLCHWWEAKNRQKCIFDQILNYEHQCSCIESTSYGVGVWFETWIVTKALAQRLDAPDTWSLRKIFRIPYIRHVPTLLSRRLPVDLQFPFSLKQDGSASLATRHVQISGRIIIELSLRRSDHQETGWDLEGARVPRYHLTEGADVDDIHLFMIFTPLTLCTNCSFCIHLHVICVDWCGMFVDGGREWSLSCRRSDTVQIRTCASLMRQWTYVYSFTPHFTLIDAS